MCHRNRLKIVSSISINVTIKQKHKSLSFTNPSRMMQLNITMIQPNLAQMINSIISINTITWWRYEGWWNNVGMPMFNDHYDDNPSCHLLRVLLAPPNPRTVTAAQKCVSAIINFVCVVIVIVIISLYL